MKIIERDKARLLRRKGLSINEIVDELKVSKASVSTWVRDVELTLKQRQALTSRGFSVAAVDKRRKNRIDNTNRRHQVVVEAAKSNIGSLSRSELMLVGAALYWGEGNKSNRNVAGIANSDPDVIKIMMRFFIEICEVESKKFRGLVHTFSHLNAKEAEKYWSNISGIPSSQFYKTYSKPSSASKGKRDTLPYGTFQIYVCDTNVALKIKGWIEKLKEFGREENLR